MLNSNHGNPENANKINTEFNIINYACYSQLEYNLNALTFNIGVRYDMNNLNYIGGGTQYDPVLYSELNTPIEDKLSYNDSGASFAFTVSHNISNRINQSIELSKGYKPGGINQSIILDSKSRNYIKETNLSIEYQIDYNSELTSFKTNFFYVHRNNPQVRLYYQFNPEIPTTFDFYTSNANNGYTYGSEFNFTILLS